MSEPDSEMRVLVSNLKQLGNKLEVQLKLGESSWETSPTFNFCGLLRIQIINECLLINIMNDIKKYQTISVLMFKIIKFDSFTYKVGVECTDLKSKEKSILISDYARWYAHYKTAGGPYLKELHFAFTLDLHRFNFQRLPIVFEYTEMPDFELRGVDGSVKVHKDLLVRYSDVMRTMLSGEWKETSVGAVQVSDTTKKTLKHLKNFMYLHKLPDNGIKELTVLASYYMMAELENRCIAKLLTTLTAENVDDILDFAVQFDIKRLELAILGKIREMTFVKKFSL